MNNEVSIIQLKENEVKRTIIEGTTYGSTMLTMNKMASGFPKPKEIMNVSLDPDKNRDLLKVIPDIRENEESVGYRLKADIILAGTIPAEDLMLVRNPNEDAPDTITAQFMHLDPEQIIAHLKQEQDAERPIMIGCHRIIYKFPKANPVVVDSAVRISRDLEFDWYPIFSVSVEHYRTFSNPALHNKIIGLMNTFIDVRDKAMTIWYATQLALLNPVIKERFHRETIPAPAALVKSSKNKKAPKKYVKRITIGDISDIEIGKTKKSHSISEPFWWVSGHMRNQKVRDGHKLIFIQGYWKGPLREQAEQIYSEPRQRELVINNKEEN